MTSISRFVNNLYCRYTLHEKLNLNLQEPDRRPFVSFCMLKSFFHLLSFFFFPSLNHSLSFLVTCCITCCHSFSFVVTRCSSLSIVLICCPSLSLVAIRYTAGCHSLSLDIPLVCLFINDPFFLDMKLLQTRILDGN